MVIKFNKHGKIQSKVTEIPVREWEDAMDVVKHITVLFSFSPPDELNRGKQTVVGFFNDSNF